jgi:hypothetical protein
VRINARPRVRIYVSASDRDAMCQARWLLHFPSSPLVAWRLLNLTVEMLEPSLTLTSKDNSFASLDPEVISSQTYFGEAQLLCISS